jgi:hypothetical protein
MKIIHRALSLRSGKTWFPYMAVLTGMLTQAVVSAQEHESPVFIDFEQLPASAAPAGFTAASSATGSSAQWQIQAAAQAPSGTQVLAASSKQDEQEDSSFYIYDAVTAADADISVHFRVAAERPEQIAGLVFRWQDAGHFYLLRADARVNSVRLYRIIDGRRRLFGSYDKTINADQWQTLRVQVQGDRFEVFLNEQRLFLADGQTLTAPGKIGLLIQGDGLTLFDDLSITVLSP